MSKELNDVAPSRGEVSTLYVAVEVSGKSWVIGIGAPEEPGKVGMHTLAPADTGALVAKIGKACARFGDPCRHAPEIEVVVCDPASLEVVRKKKKAKTDRIDARRMVRALRAWDQGEAEALSVVRIPTVEEEDAKRLLRHRDRLVKERTSLGNTIKGLLKLHGVRDLDPRSAKFTAGLAEVRTAYGTPLPPGLRNEIEATHERLLKVMEQLAEVEREKAASQEGASPEEGRPGVASMLVQLTGANDALLLQNEVFYRNFRNRRELGGWAGLAPVPWASGGVENDQGISKAGRPLVRKHLVQMAWRWLRWQPDSEITRWFNRYCARRRDRLMRKRAIVAVARKLLVALWRYVRHGLVPTGAVLAK